MPNARPPSPEKTRTSLLRAASELFAEGGFDGTTVEAIAGRARANKALINYYFGGKGGLYSAILEATIAPALERLRELRLEPLPPAEKLCRFIELFADTHVRHPTLSTMLLREALSGGRQFTEKMPAYVLEMFSHLTDILAGGVREGSFRKVDPLLTHLTIVGALVWFFATQRARADIARERKIPLAPSPGEFVRNFIDLITRALSAPRPGAPQEGV